MPPSPPNKVDKVGFWGPPTSTLDWCEYNYEISFYMAEFFVGIGSWLFHMTLLYRMQLMDELPMVWGTLASAYALFDINSSRSQINWWLASLLITYGSVITVIYITINVPIFHQVAYGLLVTACFLYSYILSRKKYFPMRWFVLSLGLYLIGFCVWNIDNVFCRNLRHIRQRLPVILGPITQLHAWWHFFAGYASYLSILYLQQARLTVLKRRSSIKFGVLGLYVKIDMERDRAE
ncbi:alkaline ceramidase 3-like isoform X2 [Varroa jacobsoni]|uniref:Alkaline ceramidase n=1 Tax=Varroa destructor TaxID=109461 RepID=A0A7M7JCN3_VARDE|nr:alkaline ceramidase 3-like isoform X2 [Varroa destructor]XP_022695648.1 alkaline ceramidase 3-like isoform X2 [Varroa jacobsoni]